VGLIEQLGNFQTACRDVARRIGLVPFTPAVNDRFDSKCHESSDSQAMPVTDARVRDTIATGFTYQGKLLRPALVSLQNSPTANETSAMEEANGQEVKEEDEVEEEQSLL
jgi:molecular chaperone GrpE (heat shock protein)